MRTFVALSFVVAVVVSSPLLHVGPQGRIIKGSVAVPHQFPYQAALILRLDKTSSRCGGSLISPQWVLTAAHCLEGIKSVKVMLGAHNIEQQEDERYETELYPDQFVIHKGWNPTTVENDIALLKLPEPVALSRHIQTIALPKRAVDTCALGCSKATISGWGATENGSTDVLKYVYASIITNAECKKAGFGAYVRETNICSHGDDSKGACSGDSGGPLMVYENQSPTLVGVTSFGAYSCDDGSPSVFTRVQKYLDWISINTGIEVH